jgi:phosphoribosylaminoimidazole (AIR) synthetase
LIQQESGEDWKDMYKSFNCGVGIDIVGQNSPVFITALKEAAVNCGLPLYRLGVCQKLPGRESEKNRVLLSTLFGDFQL